MRSLVCGCRRIVSHMDVIREYEPWELNSPVLPPTTRLYSLSPIGVGTPMVESLTGYIARLAEAHCVSTGLLYWKEIKALAGKGNIFSFRVTGDGGYSTHTINGHGSPAADFVRVMEVLTGRRDLRYLTLLHLGAGFAGAFAVAPLACLVRALLSGMATGQATNLRASPLDDARREASARTIAANCATRVRIVRAASARWTGARGPVTAPGARERLSALIRHQVPRN